MRLLLTGFLIATLTACGAASGGPQATADSITKAVYSNDTDSASANFDDALKQHITRASVGTLSDQLHRLGDYKGLTYLSADPAKNEFDYRADFTNGSVNVVLRLDTDGKASAYRVFPVK